MNDEENKPSKPKGSFFSRKKQEHKLQKSDDNSVQEEKNHATGEKPGWLLKESIKLSQERESFEKSKKEFLDDIARQKEQLKAKENAIETKLKTSKIVYILLIILIVVFSSGAYTLGRNSKEAETVIETIYVTESTTAATTTEKITETTTETTTKATTKATTEATTAEPEEVVLTASKLSLDNVPEYDSDPYVIINNNEPYFDSDELSETSFETYSELDSEGRCGEAFACVGTDIMPTAERGSIGQVKPTGWHTVKYDCVSGKYLYNRCHLIAYELAGENANVKNLITGTRYMNIDGMLPFENMVHDYVEETDNHVMYRVTPMFNGDDLLAKGVEIEAFSVEDEGDGICFNVFCYNVQPGVYIDYETGESALKETTSDESATEATVSETTISATSSSSANESVTVYITKTGAKYHRSNCSSLSQSKIEISLSDAKSKGYTACARCNPPS